jgi:hypothetical protein
VVHLKNQNAIKSAGPALNLTNESTIFLVYNASGFSVSHFDLLSGANGSVRIAESSGRAMSILQGGQALWQTWNSTAAFSRCTTSKSIISTAASFYRSNSYGRSSWSNVESGASFNPQAIALNLTHLGAQAPVGELELQAILIYNRVLSVHEQFMIERFLAKMSGDKISYCSNSRFDFGKGAVIYGFQGTNMAAYPAQKLIYATYNEVFSDNPTLSTQPSANTSKLSRIFVRGGSQATAFYKDLVVLVPGAYYSVHMNVMYGQTSPPHLALKIAGVQVDDVELSPSLGDVQDLVLRFRYLGHTPTTTFELFNLNESTSGNTFGVREITLVPDMFVNV